MRIACRNLNLDIKAPLSKSVYHRELIINYLLGARGSYLEESPDDNDDIRATKACLRALENNDSDTVVLNCNESGSTLRFMIPVALSCKSEKVKTLVFKTKGRLNNNRYGFIRFYSRISYNHSPSDGRERKHEYGQHY